MPKRIICAGFDGYGGALEMQQVIPKLKYLPNIWLVFYIWTFIYVVAPLKDLVNVNMMMVP